MADQKILLFHKDNTVLRDLSQSLGKLGFSVISSSNFQYTMELAKEERPHCLIWGDELNLQAKKSLKSLKDSAIGRNLCIFALAGNSENVNLYDRVEAQHFGVDDFIQDFKDVAQIQSRINFHQKYQMQIRSHIEKSRRFKHLSESTISLMLSRGIANVCEILDSYFAQAYPRLFHILAVNTSQNGQFDYFNISVSGKQVKFDLEKIKMNPVWKEKLIGVSNIQKGEVKDPALIKAFQEWGLDHKTVFQYPIQGRGKSAGILLFAPPPGFTIDEEEDIMLLALFRSASQRLIEVKRIYSLERDGTKKQAEEQNYFGKPSEDEVLVILCKLIIAELHPEICLYINYHEGFKFLYPKYCFIGENSKNLFEKEKPPVLLIKDFHVFESVIQNKKTELIDLKRSKEDAKLKKLPGFEGLDINNVVILPMIVSQMVQGFFVVGRESFIEKFSGRELKKCEKLIAQAAEALEEDQILRTAKLTIKQLNRIFDLGSELTLDISLEKLLEKVSIAIRRTLGWNVVILDLKDQYEESFTNLQILGMSEKDYKNLIDIAGFPPFVARQNNSFPVSSSFFYDHKQKYSAEEPSLRTYYKDQIGSEWNDNDWVYIPIKSRGNLLGIISLNDPVERRRPNEERIRSVEYFANQAAVIIENYELIDGIKSSELKYRLLAETMTMGLVTCDPERNILYANQSLAQLLKYESADQLINQKLCDFTESSSKHRLIKTVHDILSAEISSSETEGSTEGVELDLIAKDGEEIPFMVYMSPFYQHGKKVGFFSVLSDLRNQKKIERLKADFNSMIVHDLRSPLNIIQGYVDIVRTEVVGTVTEEQAELLTIAKENVFKVLKLIDNFLIASKLEAGHFQIEASINSMNGLIDTIWDHYQVLANEKKIKLDKDLDENLPMFSFDKFRIEQVVRNFLSNALKFTPPEGNITITTRLKKTKEKQADDIQMFAEVAVVDTGVGIPDDELEKVFNKYEQTEAGKDASLKGTGLGLAICREIVDLHSGEVWVKSELHSGSTFGFSLPIQAIKI